VEQLSQSRSQLQEMIDQAPDLILLLDREGRIRYANEQTGLLGEARERLIGRSALDWLGGAEGRELLLAELAEGRRVLREIELRAPGARRQALAQLALSPLPASHAGPAVAMAILRDLTEQRRLEAQAREAEKLKAVMLAAVTVNHEINNPLTSILGNLYMLRRELGAEASPDLLRRIDLAEDSAHQIERVAQQLEKINEIKMVKYLGDMEMLDIDLHADEGQDT
jgi:two-component system, cell cycle sensor histidine kinase and response regulator CckA